MLSLDKLIDNTTVLNPDKVAIKHNDRTFTYRQVNEISTQLARFFKDKNVQPGDIMGMAIDRSPEMVITLLAIVKAGATYLPIDNDKFPIDRINYMLDDSSVKTLITSKKHQSKYHHLDSVLFIENAWEECTQYDAESFEAEITEDTIAYILYTSGSTGNPKGVEVMHTGLVNLLLSVQKEPGMNADDIMLNTTTISFDIAELEVYLPLITGALLVLANADDVKDGRSLLEIAEKENITIMQGTPFMWRTMLEAGWQKTFPFKIFCGGEAMTKELASRLVTRCKELWNMYGPTETTIYSIIKKVGKDDEVITIGKPIDNTLVYILDENMNMVAPGEVGEIYIAGTGVGRGYINRPDLTEERFIDDKFTPAAGDKMYKTGDLGKLLPNGDIHCLGRIDHQIKIRGYRIETEEVEFQLKQQKNVKEALITLYDDSLDNTHLVAYVVPVAPIKDDDTIDFIKSWKKGLAVKLPDYMIPNAYTVISAIPLMPNGKIDRKSLPEPIINHQSSADYEAPADAIETALVDIWMQNIAVDAIGVNDNIFELGIDSLVAVSIMMQVEKQLDKRLPLSTLINYPTVRKLASLIKGDNKDEYHYKSLVPIRPKGTKIPVYIIHGIGLNLLNLYTMVANLDDDQPVYGIQSIGLDGTMKLPDSLEEIAAFYISEIIHRDAVGPYAIAGYSFGGIIAFEMVRQLKEMGKEVKFLAMFDTNIQYPTHQYPTLKKLVAKTLRQFKKVAFRLYTLVFQPAEAFKYLIHGPKAEEMPDFMQEISTKLDSTYYSYTVKPQHIKINLFKASVRMYYVDDQRYLGWKNYALDGMEIFTVPGDHHHMFIEENAAIFAKALQTQLNKIN